MNPSGHVGGPTKVDDSLVVPARNEMKNTQHRPVPCRIVELIDEFGLIVMCNPLVWSSLVTMKHADNCH